MQITDSDFTRPKDEYSSYFGRSYDVLVVSDDQTTANMDPCFKLLFKPHDGGFKICSLIISFVGQIVEYSVSRAFLFESRPSYSFSLKQRHMKP